MQTPTLPPIQNSNPAPQAKAGPSAPAPDGDFQRTLSRQLEQRQIQNHLDQAQAQAQSQARLQAQARPAQPAAARDSQTRPAAENQVRPAEAPPTEAPADPAKADAGTKADAGADTKAGANAAADTKAPDTPAATSVPVPAANGVSDAQAAQASPMANMLAMLASFNQTTQPSEAARAGAPLKSGADALAVAAKAKLQAGTAADTAATIPDAAPAATEGAPAKPAAAIDAKPAPAGAQADATLLAVAKLHDGLPRAELKESRIEPAVAPLQQQAALQVAAAVTAAPADSLNGRVGTPAWDKQLGQKIVWMAAGGEQSATLTLNPPDLGPLQVVLKVTNDHADASFMSAQPEVRQALEAAMPRLREMMGEAGITLNNSSVSSGMSEQGRGGNGQAGMGRGGSGGSGGGDLISGTSAAMPTRRGAIDGMVDTFA
ncbi:flagellar hook-length control protein FliK [Oxalobacteraceae bacterium GrIS 1.11]